jgi:DNA ligase (NAD+)
VELEPDEVARQAAEISGFGPKMVEALRAFLDEPLHRRWLEDLASLGVSRPQPESAPLGDGPLLGKTFCVTGVLTRKRDDVHADIRRAGGVVHDKIKKDTNYLVIGEKVGQTKLTAAKKAGTAVISESDLAELLAGTTMLAE